MGERARSVIASPRREVAMPVTPLLDSYSPPARRAATAQRAARLSHTSPHPPRSSFPGPLYAAPFRRIRDLRAAR